MISYLNVEQYCQDLETISDSDLEALSSSNSEVQVIEKYESHY